MKTRQELQKQLKTLQKKEKERVEKICSSEEFQKLYKKGGNLQEESNKFYDIIGKIQTDNSLIYLDDDKSPTYTNYDSNWGGSERNIREETLKGIKRALGITNLSSLKASEIEEVVQKLINNKLNNNKEYQEKIDERIRIDEEIEDIDEKKDKLSERRDGFWEEESKLYKRINRIEREEQRKKDMKNKEKRKKAIKCQKRDEAREKLKNINNKLDKIHTEIIKERIVNNLEEEEDE